MIAMNIAIFLLCCWMWVSWFRRLRQLGKEHRQDEYSLLINMVFVVSVAVVLHGYKLYEYARVLQFTSFERLLSWDSNSKTEDILTAAFTCAVLFAGVSFRKYVVQRMTFRGKPDAADST